MANHTTPPFQVATGFPLEEHVLPPIESNGPICGVLTTPAVKWCTIYTSLRIIFCIILRFARTKLTDILDGASNGDGRHGQKESNPQPTALMKDGRNHYATRHATKNGSGKNATKKGI